MPAARPLLKQMSRLALVAAAIAAGVAPAIAEVAVGVDRAKVMRVARPADVVIIGNPAIADATVRDNQTLIITGKSFGATNLIVLDAAGQAIAEDLIVVTQPDDAMVTVYSRGSRQTFSCKPDCAPTLTIGDSPAVFSGVNTQIQAHGSLSSN